jgi:hypothetical protein
LNISGNDIIFNHSFKITNGALCFLNIFRYFTITSL